MTSPSKCARPLTVEPRGWDQNHIFIVKNLLRHSQPSILLSDMNTRHQKWSSRALVDQKITTWASIFFNNQMKVDNKIFTSYYKLVSVDVCVYPWKMKPKTVDNRHLVNTYDIIKKGFREWPLSSEIILFRRLQGCQNYILWAGKTLSPSPSNRLGYTSKCRFFNSLYDSGWPHSKFGAQPFENSKKPVLKLCEACIVV